MTSVPPDARETAPVPQTLADWFQLNSRYVTIGLVAIGAGILGYWFYNENAERQARAAEQALLNARRSLVSGNVQLAETDLKKVVDGHKKTRAGVEAALLLTESLYGRGKFAEGIEVLDDYVTSRTAEVNRAKIYTLIGDGRMEMGKPADAAADYQRAADAARFDGERTQILAKRARALGAAGDTASARKAWEALIEAKEAAGVAAEARVRLGELATAPANRS